MKGHVTTVSAIFAASILSACSTSPEPLTVNEEDVVTYESRCGFHEQEFDGAKSITPISRKDPHFPAIAARKRLQGYARMEFDISETGKPVNIHVIEAYPGDTFANAAAASLSGWKYPTEASTCQSVEITFLLE